MAARNGHGVVKNGGSVAESKKGADKREMTAFVGGDMGVDIPPFDLDGVVGGDAEGRRRGAQRRKKQQQERENSKVAKHKRGFLTSADAAIIPVFLDTVRALRLS